MPYPLRLRSPLGNEGPLQRSRNALAREIVNFVAAQLPEQPMRVLAESPRPSTRGRRPSKGKLSGSPNTLARKRLGWQDHSSEADAQIQTWQGLWHSVLPGRLPRLVVVRRKAIKRTKKTTQRKPPSRIEAFFTTDLSLSIETILALLCFRPVCVKLAFQ